MRIVVWQYIYSMIDLPYIIGMAKDPRVKEVVYISNPLTQERKDMGWTDSFPGLENCKVFSNLTDEDIEDIIKETPNDSVHLFSGLNVYPHVHRAFLISLKYSVRRAIICERPMTYAFGFDWIKPLWLHRLRSRIINKKYFKYINYVFEIGESSSHYNKTLYNLWKVFPFAYCTRNQNDNQILPNTPYLQVSFVGALSVRKSVITILRTAKLLKEKGIENKVRFNIVGDGDERFRLEKYITKHKLYNVHLWGSMKNTEIPSFLSSQDVFVLPSIHDGWGAVINEALQAGLYTICSDRCGAKELLDGDVRGRVIKKGDYYLLGDILYNCIENISTLRQNRNKRKEWAREKLSGDIIGKYLIDCIDGKEPNIPWEI